MGAPNDIANDQARPPRAWTRLVDGYIRAPDAMELIVSDHCNIACRQCNHASPILPKWNLSPEDAAAQLALLAKVYRPPRVKLIGGEPILNPKLAEIIQVARDSGVSERFTLITNGILLPRLSDRAWDLLDEVEISAYPNVGLTEGVLDRARETGARRGVKVVVHRFHSFRYTFSRLANPDADQVQRVFTACKIATIWGCHALYRGRLYRCPQSIYVRAFAPDVPEQGVALADDEGFQARLLAFLNANEALAACSHCLGTCGSMLPHGVATRRAWRDDLAAAPGEMVDPALLERTQRWKPILDDCKTDGARRVRSSQRLAAE